MLVDLARNDLSIHCHPVGVEKFREVQLYSHVIHLVSKVTGTLNQGESALAVLTSTFPAGTLSGAPKYKAMQLLDTYEPYRRYFYGGALGYIGFNGDIIHAIMIRSLLSKDGVLYSQAGSGIVADSVPATEVAEVRHKLGALRAALEMAEGL
jgi:anthranilate synthase component 1